jgi:subtilase family serine protease
MHHYLQPRAASHAADMSWSIGDLCAAYGWPKGLVGGGTIAILELGGACSEADTLAFCAANHIPAPSVTHRYVDGAGQTTMADNASGEVALDVQIAAASYSIATGKSARILIYWCKDIAAGIRAAADEGCDICSISWGSDEALWPEAAARTLEATIAYAVAKGMVVFAAAGDNDSSDGGPNPANVDLPAGCPSAIGCGGTSKTSSETVWQNNPGATDGSGTGGGFSKFFAPLPGWQAGAPNGPGRMVPDVAANAAPETGYRIVLNGEEQTVGGTSAVAPLYAGLFAAFGTKLGWVTPKLWTNHLCFNDITVGENGAFRARPGPDACTGLGSPIGTRLAALFAK